MDDYGSRVDRIRTMIRACLDSHEEDEDFFSASDGGESLSRSRADHEVVEKDGNNFSAADSTAACTSSIGIASEASIADDGRGEAEAGCSPLPANHERGPTSDTEHIITRLVSKSSSTLMGGGSPQKANATLADKGGVTCSRRATTMEAEPDSCTVGRRSLSNNNTSGESAAAQTLAAATSREPCGVVSFAGISVSGLRLLVEVGHRRSSLEICLDLGMMK